MDVQELGDRQKEGLTTLYKLFILTGIFLVCLFLFNFLAFVAVIPLVGFNLAAITELIANPTAFPEGRTPLMLMQGVTAIGSFIIAPLVYLKWIDKPLSMQPQLRFLPLPPVSYILLTVLIVLASMPLNAMVVKWNEALRMPEFLQGFEQWAMSKEESLKVLTLYLVNFQSLGEFFIGFVVIAIIPGIGEELLFRGLIQQKLQSVLKNVHVAIWLTAFIFSAFHLQFYGLVPRMLLGALFGYLYVWSGSLFIPILAHFVNNAFTVSMMYLYNQGQISTDIENVEQIPWEAALFSGLVSGLLLLTFYRLRNRTLPA